MDGMTDFESVGRGSIPRRGAWLECETQTNKTIQKHCPWSVPDSHATPRRSRIRFDSWRGHFVSEREVSMALEPDGQAIGCNPIEVGSIPTGVFSKQGLDIVWPAAH